MYCLHLINKLGKLLRLGLTRRSSGQLPAAAYLSSLSDSFPSRSTTATGR